MNAAAEQLERLRAEIGKTEMPGIELGLHLAGMRRHHQDAVADQQRLLDRVGDEDHGEADLVPQRDQLLLHLAPGQRIERGERLVHQQHRRLHGQRAGDGDALLHAARQHVRIGVLEGAEIDLGDHLSGLLARGGARHAAVDQQREHDVAEHRLPRQQLVEFLEHHHAVGARPLDRLAVEPDRARHRRQKAGDRLEQRRFAAARRAEQHVAVAAMDLERYLPGRGDQMVLRLVLQRDLVGDEQRAVVHAVSWQIGHNMPCGGSLVG